MASKQAVNFFGRKDPNMTMLKGKYIIHDSGETYRTGEIIDSNEQYALVREDFMKDPDGPANMMQIVSLKEMATAFVDDGERAEWQIFGSLEERSKYMTFFGMAGPGEQDDEDESDNVIPLKAH
jgi:hypothetical protein